MRIAAAHLQYGDRVELAGAFLGEVSEAEPRSGFEATHTYLSFYRPNRDALEILRTSQSPRANRLSTSRASWVAVSNDLIFDVTREGQQ